MSELSYFLNNHLFPAVYDKADILFPEFEFRRHGDKWISGNGRKVDGSEGEKRKVYIYHNRPYRFQDYTRDGRNAITTYLQEQLGYSTWIESVRWLAEQVNIPLPEKTFTPDAIKKHEEKERRLELLEAINDFFTTRLLEDNGNEANEIRAYLDKRGYNNYLPKKLDELHLSDKMELGYIPSREALKEYLIKIGLNTTEVDTLFNHPNIGKTHKLAIPLRCLGRIIGFAFRNINYQEGGQGKYLYSSTERSSILIGLNTPKNSIKDLIIVEGILDVYSLQAQGVENIAALGSANLNEIQIKLIEKLGYETITLCLDNDNTGIKNTPVIIDNIRKLSPSMSVFVAPLIDGFKDPDELVRTLGIDDFQWLLKNSQRWFIYLLDKIFERIPDNPTQMEIDSSYKEIHKLGKRLGDPAYAKYYVDHIVKNCNKLDLDPGTIRQAFNNLQKEIEETNKRSEFNRATSEAHRLADKAQSLFEKGKETEAIELLGNIGKQRNIELSESSYKELFKPITRDDIKATLEKESDAFNTGLLIHDKPLLLPSGALSFIAGRTGRGKTATLLNLAINGAERQNGKPIVIFSYEENSRKIFMKLLNIYIGESFSENNRSCIYAYYNQKDAKFKDRQFRETFIRLEEKFFDELINTGRLIIVDSNDHSDELINKIHYLHDHKKIGAVLIDYVQRLNINNNNDRLSRHEELKVICNDLTDCAIDTGLPIILGAQFNRQATDDKETLILNNLGEGGAIERNASKVIAVNIEHNEIPNISSNFYIKVLKNRDGITEIFDTLQYDGNTGRIVNNKKILSNLFSKQTSSKEYEELDGS